MGAPTQPEYLGPFRLLEPLGRGGMGIVYLAEHQDGGAQVALKTVVVPDARLLQSIRREIFALAQLQHPGIVRILEHGVEDGLPWYAMELLRGKPLGGVTRDILVQDQTCYSGQAAKAPGTEQDTAVAPAVSGSGWWSTMLALPDTAEITPPVLDAVLNPVATEEDNAVPPAAPNPTSTWDLDDERAAAHSPAALAEILSLARRLCAPLAFLHGEGMVHRDLKPDNIIVLSDGTPVLMDFGLLTRFSGAVGREVLDTDATMGGTALYMAPEQIRAELVDARADLYALGCMLYEMLSGAPPFTAPGLPALLQEHLTRPPRRLSQVIRGLPDPLVDLVDRLLAKAPRDRVGHADDVARILGELGGEDSPADARPTSRSYLYRPGLGGREAPLSDLRARLDKLGAGQGGVVLLGGESGVGKTRLAVEFGQEASVQGAMLLTGECQEKGARPLEPLRRPLQAIADRCRQEGAEETTRVLGPRGSVLAPYEPSLADLPGQDLFPPAEELAADAARFRLLSSLSEVLAATAATTRVVLLIDDLQWADELTLDWLSFLAQGGFLERAPVMVLATYRSEEVSGRLAELMADPGLGSVTLGRLDQAAVVDMVGDMLALPQANEALGRRLAAHSEGNPFFVAEYLHAAVSEGILSRSPRGQWRVVTGGQDLALEAALNALPTPGSLLELVDRRLKRLSPETRRAAMLAAVAGREFPEALLAELAGLDDATMLETVKELLQAQVLEEADAGALRFMHDKFREAAYRALPAQQQRQAHGTAAAWYEQANAGDLSTLSTLHPLLAHHWRQARRPRKAMEHLGKAGEQALRGGAYQESLEHLTEALTLDAELDGGEATARSTVRRARWERQAAEATLGMGRLAESRGHLERAAATLDWPVPGSLPKLVATLGGNILTQARQWLRPPEPSTGSQAPRLLEGTRTYRGLIPLYYFTCEMVPTLNAGLRSLNLAQRVGVSTELAEAYANMAFAASLAPLPALALAYSGRALETARQTGKSAAMVWALEVDGICRVSTGDWDGALKSLIESARLAKILRDPRRWNEATCARQTVLHHLGQYDLRLELGRQVQEQGRLSGNLQGEAWGMLDQAESMLPLGRAEEAITFLDQVVAMLPRDIGRAEEIWTHGMLAAARFRRGQERQALVSAGEALARMAKTPPTAFYTLDGYTGTAEVFLAAWASAGPSTPTLAREARAACAQLEKFSRVMPIGLPRARLYRGTCHWLSGHKVRARVCWGQALVYARRLKMPYEQGLALEVIGQHMPPSAPGREANLAQARAIFQNLGALHHLP